MVLPTVVEKQIERFKKTYGPGWDKQIVKLLRDQMKRDQAKKELAAFMKTVSGRVKLSEREIFRRLEDRP